MACFEVIDLLISLIRIFDLPQFLIDDFHKLFVLIGLKRLHCLKDTLITPVVKYELSIAYC